MKIRLVMRKRLTAAEKAALALMVRTCRECSVRYSPSIPSQQVCHVCVLKWIENICPGCGGQIDPPQHLDECTGEK